MRIVLFHHVTKKRDSLVNLANEPVFFTIFKKYDPVSDVKMSLNRIYPEANKLRRGNPEERNQTKQEDKKILTYITRIKRTNKNKVSGKQDEESDRSRCRD